MEEKYLPIGSVVRLKGAEKSLMITGFLPIETEKKDNNKVWDYSGCVYPEGIITSNNNYLFDHEQIEKVEFVGYVTEEEKNFKNRMKQALQSLASSESSEH